jgi:uncharacterized membrane protein (Fun14 family)
MSMAQINSGNSYIKSVCSFFEKFNQDFDHSAYRFLEIASYLGIGFFIGLLIKKYFDYFLVALVSIFLSCFLANGYEVITINWSKIQMVTGINGNETIYVLIGHLTNYFKNNMATSISLMLGFVIGYKVG